VPEGVQLDRREVGQPAEAAASVVDDEDVHVTQGRCRPGHHLARRVRIGQIRLQVHDKVAHRSIGLRDPGIGAGGLRRVVRGVAVRYDGGAETEQPPDDGVADACTATRARDQRDTTGERERGLGHGRCSFRGHPPNERGVRSQRPAMDRL
jgi:hypothetical protein